jgi:hypothetical protein
MSDTVIAPRCSEPLDDPCPYTAINGTDRCLQHAAPKPLSTTESVKADPATTRYASSLEEVSARQRRPLGVTPAGDLVFPATLSWGWW